MAVGFVSQNKNALLWLYMEILALNLLGNGVEGEIP